jgi:imidazolonepropionase
VAEFESRLSGASRAASDDELVAAAVRRTEQLLADGVTTFEIKTGHGLDLEAERRMLNAASRVGEALPVRVHHLPARTPSP